MHGTDIVLGIVVTVIGGGVIALWKNHMSHSVKAIADMKKWAQEELGDLKTTVNKNAEQHRADHKEFFTRIGELETNVAVLKAKE